MPFGMELDQGIGQKKKIFSTIERCALSAHLADNFAQ
jgi:hypothetical protein